MVVRGGFYAPFCGNTNPGDLIPSALALVLVFFAPFLRLNIQFIGQGSGRCFGD
jgi:hypothetical protein